MIRIDEIYCNTFLPRIQAQPDRSMHWFDPFGSVRWQDLASKPAVAVDDLQAQRYLFWDQEPVTEQTLEFAARFWWSFQGSRHTIITSEKDSELVDRITRTYGYSSAYYFFHGWAALDWFRGYDRTYLIQPVKQRGISKTFLAPMRIVAGARQHRLAIMYHIIRNNLLDNHISFPAVCPHEHMAVADAVRPLESRYTDIAQVFTLSLIHI